jgi:hypothetical protein
MIPVAIAVNRLLLRDVRKLVFSYSAAAARTARSVVWLAARRLL